MGIDYGSKRVGVALSDPTGIIATGAGVLKNDDALLGRLNDIVRENNVTLIVVGMPFSADGGKGPQALAVEDFIRRMKEVVHVSVDTWDESLTSVDARRVMRGSGMKRKKRQDKGRVDEMAARLLVQEYLDHRWNTQH